MANDSRRSRITKDDDHNNAKGRNIRGQGSSTSAYATTDISGLRRSARETPTKKQLNPSPSNTRKSERLERQTAVTPVKRKSDRVEKQRIPSPLRRSERGKNHQSPSSSGSKRSERTSGSEMRYKKQKREKSVKEVTLEAREVEENDSESVQVKKKKMTARAYRASFLRRNSNGAGI